MLAFKMFTTKRIELLNFGAASLSEINGPLAWAIPFHSTQHLPAWNLELERAARLRLLAAYENLDPKSLRQWPRPPCHAGSAEFCSVGCADPTACVAGKRTLSACWGRRDGARMLGMNRKVQCPH
jgi:hypothetical protein